ncbi:hypothetical protein E2C01_079520 [Portunus trituberculatus]|uniref:Uncharacterized protein n=1 Tax=Portunus trituberculatus TaxID=210409 RepID=A0A5B7IH44_PORTR|nr:hypothetical protein [Portunus trituberculatus]
MSGTRRHCDECSSITIRTLPRPSQAPPHAINEEQETLMPATKPPHRQVTHGYHHRNQPHDTGNTILLQCGRRHQPRLGPHDYLTLTAPPLNTPSNSHSLPHRPHSHLYYHLPIPPRDTVKAPILHENSTCMSLTVLPFNTSRRHVRNCRSDVLTRY